MKKSVGKIISSLLITIMLMGTVPISNVATEASAKDLSSYKVGDIIEFGSYPQSKVTDNAIISALDAKSKNWISYGYYSGTGNWGDGKMKSSNYMKYCDLSYNGNKYRAVSFSSYRPNCTGDKLDEDKDIIFIEQYKNGYDINSIYYFKCEPLIWRVIDPAEGFIVCEKAIDSQAYNNYISSYNNDYYGNSAKTYYASDWENSSIRAWLNDDFYNTAFTSTEKSQIGTTYNENKSTYSNTYNSANTSDKIFLLSYDDVLNTKYGFSSSYSAYDTARKMKSTDYAQCQGCFTNTLNAYYGNSYWWLRSSYNSFHANLVDYAGGANYNGMVNGVCYGVVPALKINPKSTTPKYTISYNANGGNVSPTSTTVDSGNSVKLPTPTRSGYTCLGWSTSISATSASYSCGASYTPSKNITLYAVWKSNTVTTYYTVTFNANGGSVSPSSSTVELGKSITLPTPTKSGCACLGWSTNSSATSANFSCGASYKFTSNVTLYAVWKLNDTVKVKSVSISDIEIKYKDTAKIKPVITADDGVKYTVKYESSNPSVATVDKDGNVTTLHKGDTTITCTVTDDAGNIVKDTKTINVKFSFGQWLIWIFLLGFLWY